MTIPPQGKLPSGETAGSPVHGVDTARDHFAGAKASSPLQQAADQSAAVSSSEGSSLLELVVAAIIAPVAEDSLPKLLVPLPAAQRVEVITKSIIHLAKTRATLAAELTITSEDISLMRMRGAGATLARIISEDRVRLIPSEVLARERALTEVAALIHVGNRRDLGATERLLAILEKFGSRQPQTLYAARPALLAASPLPSPRRREPLRRVVERTRQHDEVDRFLREQLRQIVHDTLSRAGHLHSAEVVDRRVAVSTPSERATPPLETITLHTPSKRALSPEQRIASGRRAGLYRSTLRQASAVAEPPAQPQPIAGDKKFGPTVG